MSKLNTKLFYIVNLTLLMAPLFAQNVLVVDQSFAPLNFSGLSVGEGSCNLTFEGMDQPPEKDECYDKKSWNESTPQDVNYLKGLMDDLASKDTVFRGKWIKIHKEHSEEADRVKQEYLEMVHGTRVAALVYEHSKKQADILPLRIIPLSLLKKETNKIKLFPTKDGFEKIKRSPYDNGCALTNWTPDDEKKVKNGQLRSYQQKISDLLTSHSGIRVANLSLGYRLTWLGEDNPKCEGAQLAKEYIFLMQTWRNLLQKHPKVLFVVSAGNDGLDLNDETNKKDVLWAKIADEPNLLIVGSLTKKGEHLAVSNWGGPVRLSVSGEDISVESPLPKEPKPYPTTVRGTSFSSAIVGGRALDIIKKNAAISIEDLKKLLLVYK